MRIARVFPRRTRATPDDQDAYTGPPGLFEAEKGYDEIHVSVTFTWDIERAKELAEQWKSIAPVRIGGPATGMPGGEFTPGMYLKPGYVITSRGCPNRCWFCSVWRREGKEIRELAVQDGWNLLDDNLLACSEEHQRQVFDMMKRHHGRAEFTGGLEAKRLQDWHIQEIKEILPEQMFLAYDEPSDWPPLEEAVRKLRAAGIIRKRIRVYVLVGYKGDTLAAAEERLRATFGIGALPMAMLWRDRGGKADQEWSRFQRTWARPASIKAKIAEGVENTL